MLRIQQLHYDLQESDYIELSDLLTEAFGDEDKLDYEAFKRAMYSRCRTYVITLVAKLDEHIIGTASIFIEQKIIRNVGKVCHVEDVCVKEKYKKRGYGRMLLDHIKEIAKQKDCYKIILDCSDENVAFYEKCGFVKKEKQMRMNIK